jgi:cell division protein DivIC
LPEIFLSLRKGEKRTLDMSKLLTIWNYIRRHKYMITVLIFIVVIGFLDENSLIQRVKHRSEISALNSEIEKYRKQYEEDTEKLKELTTNPEALEKIAREKYLMKKPDEDIFVFEE